MSKTTKTVTRTQDETYTIVACDICGEEMPPSQIDVWNHSSRYRVIWWKEPLRYIVGIAKHDIYSTKESDFEVHVDCAYEAIRKAIDGRKETINE